MSSIDWNEVLTQAKKMRLRGFADKLAAEMGIKRRRSPKKPRKMLPGALRAFVLEMYGRRCAACGATSNLQIDHIHPRFRGGDDSLGNLQVLCWDCNKAKNYRVSVDYRAAYWRDMAT